MLAHSLETRKQASVTCYGTADPGTPAGAALTRLTVGDLDGALESLRYFSHVDVLSMI